MYNGINDSLTDSQFQKLKLFITKNYGIKIPDKKRKFLALRLRSRLLDLNLSSFAEYLDILFKDKSRNELSGLENAITTNKTDFFREENHFDFIKKNIGVFDNLDLIKCWSAGSSSGEEAYTLAMVLEDLKLLGKCADYQIIGTDLSEKVIQMAKEGVYANKKLNPVPLELKKRYLLKGKGNALGYSKFQDKIRRKIFFKKLNFMDRNYGPLENHKFEMIFCRNVLIYFNQEEQIYIIKKLLKQLRPNGFFFIGHSESLIGMEFNLQQIKPATYQKIK